ncbi:hypothetical protein YK48G_21550 [Lentilactobacillus fungorum]|jgi:hypothetical protein|uniref:DUF4828 domain-containing protein n=1 Tax=Lentilactobacillus fungorum TaxID=2201250 RepID=A0ABQ3W1M3_9LACO|nr:DUF4828 domain-containing protein [Lentilactobacillus fungorum]GHP14730.1 hypothetical protein YK48G_21550 [Lentilactobacillus fungorum]
MRKRSVLLFLISLVLGLFHTPRASRKQLPKVDPRFFVGSWHFKDRRDRDHKIVIDPDLRLTIDNHDMSAKVSSITRYELSYIDKYGYKLEIRGNEARPVKFYDESENCTYDLLDLN